MIRFATSLLVVLLTNVLNRILIVEFHTPATLIVFIFAFQHLATPSGLVAGYFSDKLNPKWRRRTPFILGGMLLSLAVMPLFPFWGMAFAAQPDSRYLFWSGVALFFLFGIGTTVSATAINALLVDQVQENQRGAGMALVWILTLAGFIIGSGFFHYLFPGDQINRLELIFWIFTGLALAITLVGIIGIEGRPAAVATPPLRLDGIGKILKGFGQSKQALLFFAFLAATIFFPAMQIFILTPFGGEILKLSVGETAQFGMYTSYGTLLGMIIAFCWQKKPTALMDNFWLGAALAIGAVAFGLLSWSAWQPHVFLGQAGMWIFGFSKGLYNVGISFLTMRLAHSACSGVFMGLWNLISGLALAMGEMTGGFFLHLGERLFGTMGAAYGTVFLVVSLGLLGCLLLLTFINLEAYRREIAAGLDINLASDGNPRELLPIQDN
ncbi:MAG TPA: MFS transporter [Thermodesulfobacteriota bacterium]|nr:MFS transporter [Thermodesulfobacteriota bacterium]